MHFRPGYPLDGLSVPLRLQFLGRDIGTRRIKPSWTTETWSSWESNSKESGEGLPTGSSGTIPGSNSYYQTRSVGSIGGSVSVKSAGNLTLTKGLSIRQIDRAIAASPAVIETWKRKIKPTKVDKEAGIFRSALAPSVRKQWCPLP